MIAKGGIKNGLFNTAVDAGMAMMGGGGGGGGGGATPQQTSFNQTSNQNSLNNAMGQSQNNTYATGDARNMFYKPAGT